MRNVFLLTVFLVGGLFCSSLYAAPAPCFQMTDSVVGPDCHGNDGFALVALIGGSGHYRVTWSPTPPIIQRIGNNFIATNPAIGTYQVYAFDSTSGCNDTIQFAVTGAPDTIPGPDYHHALCYSVTKDTINANPTNSSFYHYLWSNNSTASSIIIDTGSFAVTVTNILNNCTASFSGHVPQDFQIHNTNILTLHLCGNPPTADVKLDGLGGIGFLTYTVQGVGTDTSGSFPALSPGTYTFIITDSLGCTQTGSVSIPQGAAGQTFTVNTDSGDCSGQNTGTVVITPVGSSANNFEFQLDGGGYQFSDTFKNVSVGTHTIVAKNIAFGCTYQFTAVVYPPGNIAKPVYTQGICYGQTDDTINANPTGGTSYHFSWSTGDTSSYIVSGGGFFSVTVTNTANNCSAVFSDTIRQDIQIHNTNILNLYVCAVPAHGDLQLDGVGGTGILTYTVTGVGTDSSGSFPGLVPGSYSFTITDALGCTQTGSVNIPQSAVNQDFTVTSDSVTCGSSSNGTIVVTPTGEQEQTFQYQLDGGIFQPSGTFTGVSAGTHVIVAKSNPPFGCVYNLSDTVYATNTYNLSVTPDTINGHLGSIDTITTVTDYPNPVYEWSPVTGLSCNDCANPIVTVDTSLNKMYYYVKVYNADDSTCYSVDSVYVLTELTTYFKMPSAFTPNGDGHDDAFGPVQKTGAFSGPTVKQFRVYNRWGQLMFNSSAADATWDGRFKGSEQPVGTYVYYIEVQYTDMTGKNVTAKQEGNVTLLR